MKQNQHSLSRTGARIIQPGSNMKTPRSPKSPKVQNSKSIGARHAKPLKSLTKYSFPLTPLFKDTSIDAIDALFETKIEQTLQMVSPDLHDDYLAKTILLEELLHSMSTLQISENIRNYNLIFTMFSLHLYKNPTELPLYFYSAVDLFDGWDLTPENWKHISYIYDIATVFIKRKTLNVDLCWKQISDLFKLAVFRFRTPYPAEHTKLTKLVITIYRRIPKIQQFANRVFYSSLIRLIYDKDPFTVGRPLLAVLTTVKSHTLIKQSIFQLLRHPFYSYFHQNMKALIAVLLEEDNALSIELIRSIVRHWPKLNGRKQNEFVELITLSSSFIEDVEPALKLLMPRFVFCVTSCQAFVAETSLLQFQVNDFVWLMTSQPQLTYPMLIPALFETAGSYWEPIVRSLARTVLDVLRKNNPKIFDLIGKRMPQIKSGMEIIRIEKGQKWSELVRIVNPPNKKLLMKQIRILFQ